MKITKKKIIIAIVGLVLIIFLFSLRNGDVSYNFETVSERHLVKEIFESGSVKSGDSINLSFQSSGKINSIPVYEGQVVQKGDLIASIDKSDLITRQKQAENRVEIATAEISLLKEGGRTEDIQNLENRLEDALKAVEIAQRSLDEVKDIRDTNLQTVYSRVPSLVSGAYLLSKEVNDAFSLIRDNYFVGFYNQDTYKARNTINQIDSSYQLLRDKSRSINLNSSWDELNNALLEAEKTFLTITESIETVIEVSETDHYEGKFSDEAKNIFWETKSATSTMLSNISSLRNEIRAIRENSRSALTSAESGYNSAIARKNEIEDAISSMKLGGRDAQITAAEAGYNSAIEDLNLIKRQIQRADIYAPVSGRISQIFYKPQEEAIPSSPAVTLIATGEHLVELNIYEADVVKISVGDKAEIEFVPFPDEIFFGEVIAINETGKLINGVVYYEVKVSIENPPTRLMSEMTADVTILIEEKTTISLSREAIKRSGITRYVNVLENGEIVKKDIEIGISDSYGYYEIISGLQEGDQVIVD